LIARDLSDDDLSDEDFARSSPQLSTAQAVVLKSRYPTEQPQSQDTSSLTGRTNLSLGATKKQGARNVAKTSVVLLLVILASALATSQALDPVPGESGPHLKAAYSGSALTCTQPPTYVVVPRPPLERAKLKARFANLLRESLDADAQGIVNTAREKEIEIKILGNRLRSDRQGF
jgi:hypothetical protein